MARPMSITAMEDGSVVLAIQGERAIPLSLEEFQALQRLVAPIPAVDFPAMVEQMPFPSLEGLVA